MTNRFVDKEGVVLFEDQHCDDHAYFGIGDQVTQDGIWYAVRDVIVSDGIQRVTVEPEREPGDEAQEKSNSDE